jgi:hypothetical protein
MLYVPQVSFNMKKFYILAKGCIGVFCMHLRTHNAYFPIQLYLTVFVIENECVQCALILYTRMCARVPQNISNNVL